jgi:hypothetical protein
MSLLADGALKRSFAMMSRAIIAIVIASLDILDHLIGDGILRCMELIFQV